MSNQTTTPAAEPATISRKELWEQFVNNAWRVTLPMGPTVTAYEPGTLIRDCGENGDMQDFTDMCADDIADNDDPLDALDYRIRDIGNYLDNMKMIREDFERLMRAMAVVPDDYDEDDSRYHRPALTTGEAA